MISQYWKVVARTDERARALADRHYSRKKPGAVEFCPPGNNIVLLAMDDDALWVSHRSDPKAQLERPRADGFDYWDNPYFRNESEDKAIPMINEAVAITLWFWRDIIPSDGFHTFIDTTKVKPIYEHSKPVYGWVFREAGFDEWPERTKERGLVRRVLSREKLQAMTPLEPYCEQMRLFA